MSDRYQQNRRDLDALMKEMGRFSLNDLIEKFKIGRPIIAIDAHETIKEYVERLAEQGGLRYLSPGRYEVV